MGILKPAKVDPKTKYRYYTADQAQQLNAILDLKELGFSLLEIKKLLDGGITDEKFMEALVHKKTAWQNIIASIENKINTIYVSSRTPLLKRNV
jgi:DNA-binding transcriptional MerR regulator